MSAEELTDEEFVRRLVADAEKPGPVEERAGVASAAVVRSLSRATGYTLETVAWALVRQDVAALFGVPAVEPTQRVELHGDVRALPPPT